MAGRKKKGYEVELRLQKYLDTYELDDLNEANDLSSLRQLASYEIIIENLQEKIAGMKDLEKNSKLIKDLNAALRDAVQSYSQLQTSLGIDRKKRKEEGNESLLDYVTKLKSQSKKIMDRRFVTLECEKCKLTLVKYHVYIQNKGEPGSLVDKDKPVEAIKYNVQVECPRCEEMVTATNII